MQVAAEAALASQAVPAAVVAIRPSTGDVLAAASSAAGGLSTATTAKAAPGSTFKVITALTLLRAGLTPDSPVPCTPDINVNGRTFTNIDDYPASALGDIPLRTAFAHSCNTAMISQAQVVSQQALHDAAADLGVGVAVDLGAPAFFGDVPASGTATEHAASMIGQAKVEVSPLTMATVAASVAAGHRVSPVLVRPAATAGADAAGTPSGGSAPGGSAPGTAVSAPPSQLTSQEAEALHSLMRSVVTDGTATVLADLPGDVAAKTGTAEYGNESKAHAWMIAIQGDLAVAVYVETCVTGATTAGPIMHDFLNTPNLGS
jgi:cell division protein FtsI/penicillin-binding protein 2